MGWSRREPRAMMALWPGRSRRTEPADMIRARFRCYAGSRPLVFRLGALPMFRGVRMAAGPAEKNSPAPCASFD